MRDSENSAVQTLMKISSKAVFALGIFSAANYLFHPFQSSHPLTAQSQSAVQTSVLDSKVAALQAQALAQKQNGFVQNIVQAVVDTKSLLSLSAPKTAAVAASASPTPAVPGATPAPGEASAENKEAKTGEEPVASADVPVQANALISPEQMAAFGYAAQNAAVENHPVSNPSSTGTSNSVPASPGFAGGFTSLGTLNANGASPRTQLGNGASGAGTTQVSTSAGSSTSTSTSTSGSSFLSQADLSLLTANYKSNFSAQSLDLAGLICAPAHGGLDCSRTGQYAVNTSRWSKTEGFSDSTISLRTVSGSNQLEASINVRLQNLDQTFSTLSVVARPSDVAVRNETSNGKTYRIFDLKFASLNLRASDQLTNAVASIRFEVTGSTSVLSSDSSFSFSRNHVDTLAGIWDLSGPNRAPASSDIVFTADAMPYSMNLQKSP